MDCDKDKIYKYLGQYTGLGTQDFGTQYFGTISEQ